MAQRPAWQKWSGCILLVERCEVIEVPQGNGSRAAGLVGLLSHSKAETRLVVRAEWSDGAFWVWQTHNAINVRSWPQARVWADCVLFDAASLFDGSGLVRREAA